MAKKKQESKLSAAKIKTMFKKYKIRECHVKIARLTISNNVLFRDAMFKKYGIKNCMVQLHRIDEKDKPNLSQDLSLKPIGNVRSNSNISWFPGPSQMRKNLDVARSSLAAYQTQNRVALKAAAKRQRAKSMFAEQPSGSCKRKVTLDDLHVEFSAKYNSANRGLKPRHECQLSKPQPDTASEFQKIYDEFKAKLNAKNADK